MFPVFPVFVPQVLGVNAGEDNGGNDDAVRHLLV